MNAMNRWSRLVTTAGCLLWAGAAVAQPGPTSGMAGGPSNGYAGSGLPPASRENTPVTGGGPTTDTSKSTRDEAARDHSTSGSSGATGSSSRAGALTGTISRVDPDNKTIELQGHRKLKVNPGTEIRRDGQTASFSDLHAGDDVRASFAGDDRTTVKRIDVMPNNGTSGATGSTSSSSSSMPSSPSSSPSSGR